MDDAKITVIQVFTLTEQELHWIGSGLTPVKWVTAEELERSYYARALDDAPREKE